MDANLLKFGLFIIVCTCALRVVAQGTTEYKDECIVDKSKKPTEDGNYKDCTGEDHVKDGSTDCCNVDGVIDCCDKNASWWNLIWICIGIGTTTIVLALLCFWIYWCDEQTFPWIGPYKRKWDERTGKCKSKVCCCCVDDDEDDYKTSASSLPKKTGGLSDREVRPESSISQRSSYYDDEKGVGSRNVESDVVEVQPGPESTEMPPEYQAQVKDDFLNF